MKNFIKITIIIGILAFSLCGCSNEEVKQDLDISSKANNEVEIVNEIKDISEVSLEKSGDTYKTYIEGTDNGKVFKITQDEFKVDIVLGDNYYATQIADIMLNYDSYVGKTIEIEGFSLDNGYTFVGRYSENDICPDCPTGYAYVEYEWHGDEPLKLGNEETWIKVKGQLKVGNDGVEYYYIDAYSIEVMNEWGIATVVN